MKCKNANVLITGGASGIGKIMGRIVLEKGCKNLIIWDINENALKAVADEFSSLGTVHTVKVDVSDIKSIDEGYAATKAICDVDILINNAGVVIGNSNFVDETDAHIIATMTINGIAPMLVAKRFLPDMVARNSGHIVNLASEAGMIGVPRLANYCASKWSVIGWTESLRIELKLAKSKVRTTCVSPFFINTGMFNGVTSPLFPILNPERTSKKIIRALENDRTYRGIPFGYHFTRFCQFILPLCIFDFIFGTVCGVYSCMDHFTGRK